MRSLEDIIEDWRIEVGVLKNGRNSTYIHIGFRERRSNILDLVQTMIDEGYSKEEIENVQVRNKVIDTCTPPEGVPIPAKNIKTWKGMVAAEWRDSLKHFFHGPISKHIPKEIVQYTEPEKPQKAEKELELDPKDRLKIDTSGVPDMELDTDFLKNFGLDSSFFGDGNE